MTIYSKHIRKIVAVGRNYKDHALELNNKLPLRPMIFLKPVSSVIHSGENIEIPRGSVVHHEVELGVLVGKTGRDIPVNRAMDYVRGYTLALDLTARNFQTELAKNGHPWAMAKGFDTFTPLGSFVDKSQIPDPHNVDLWCSVAGKLRQDGNTSGMIFKIPELLAFISSVMRLEKGDLILTGTPSGVGPLTPSEYIEAGMRAEGKDVQTMKFFCVPRVGDGEFSSAK